MLHVPESPRSTTSSFSGLSSSPPMLHADTLALLESFLSSKAEEEKRFNELAEQAAARVAGLALNLHFEDEQDPPMMTVDEYRLAFSEDWQLSQFWYTTAFATRLAKHVRSLCTPSSTVAFMCCPTAFVAFQHTNPLEGAKLLEYDGRFTVLAPHKFVHYDLNEPDTFPESLRGTVDLVIIDPPFLNEPTNAGLVQTTRQILHPQRGKLLLLTGTSTEPILDRLYDKSPVGPLRRTSLEVEHGGLANEFACWGSWDGAEDFGKDDSE
ncbi:Protein-lysine N-methyltransferase EFM5 [Hypsizygus marmoreus]|uniref:Protein-lysine N-methyltransferase EFM5 n=1 Tax=Hypsizygus marmoreus TaxID=39966 RepID=A0A369JPB7_HYPMA|nr:Protein-lysine N-methyltransferase EFM5 [Hypsizygus marmoreus]